MAANKSKQREAEAKEREKAKARERAAIDAAKQKAATPKPAPAPAAAPAAPAAAAAPAGTPAPAAPGLVDPFFTADDLDAINAFTTDLATKLEGIDFELKNAETDTAYQKSQNDTSAKQSSSSATDDAISRGIFSSSIKDATIYDIEAQRSLSAKFLDDKLTAQRLTAGTNKQILSTAKTNFDTNMATRKAANAQGVTDANNTAWAAAKAAWDANQPVAAPAVAAPAAPAVAAKPTAKAPANTLFAPTPTATKPKYDPSRPNTASGTGNTKPKPRVKTTVVQYGAGTA